MNYKVVLTLHDYFIACQNGGFFNYKDNKICQLKPLSCNCICTNCDSRNYAFKLYRIVRQFVQKKVVRLNDNISNVIVISKFSENILRKSLNRTIKVTKIYNPIDLDTNKLSIDYKKNTYYLFVGRLSKEKGADIFCKAISELNLDGIVVGDGSEKNFLEKKYPKIKFVGWLESDKVKEYMKQAKALIFPSRWYEGAPLTPLEILQYGIPCIISEDCAAIDYIFNDCNGISFSIKKDDINQKILEFENRKEKIDIDISQFINNDYIEEILKLYNNI